ncbi:MAG: alpha-L-rhamnosidase N-terminal domain-containing protein, partial [Lentisphaeria bacterium]|nr:alpha-L-rhamnosidase N-terminal domain-containing protein [Lentisphaeria bacterium]
MQNSAPRQFQGIWITNKDFAPLEPLQIFHRQLAKVTPPPEDMLNQHILFRKSFTLEKLPKNATLYVTADDFYKLYVNGRYVAEGPTTAYSFAYNYNTLDITPFLQEGQNTLAFHTYYLGYLNRVFVSADHQHGLLCDLVADGTTVLSSDESFKTAIHTGHTQIGVIGYNTGFMERYDANAPEVGFENADYNDGAWDYASKRIHANYTLQSQPSEMVVTEYIQPVSTEIRDDKLFVDFGQTYVGNLTFQAKGPQDALV